MYYFKRIAPKTTNEFRCNFVNNTGWGVWDFSGVFQDENGQLHKASDLNNFQAAFFGIKSAYTKGVRIIIDDESTSYSIISRTPQKQTSSQVRLGHDGKKEPFDLVTALLMLPKSCAYKKIGDAKTTIPSTGNYWLQTIYLSATELQSDSSKAVFLSIEKCVFGIGKKDSEEYYELDVNKRIGDIIEVANKKKLPDDILHYVDYFAGVYKGKEKFDYDKSMLAIEGLTKLLSEKYPALFLGGQDPMAKIYELAHKNEQRLLAAIRTKPFILLAGMSGTGKTRIVRQLAQGCCPSDSDLAKDKPGNYECIPVRPNWHDSTDLMGYVTRMTPDGTSEYVVTDFIRFLIKAWLYEEKGIPFFLCLDEMNLAPVEQYFAEFLSTIESRRQKNGKILTDSLVRFSDDKMLKETVERVLNQFNMKSQDIKKFINFFIEQGGVPIPSNFIVMGTVNMDETTCSFSRKVLDRAMTFELNAVNMDEGLSEDTDIPFDFFPIEKTIGHYTHGWQVYKDANDICEKIKKYLETVNEKLNGTPFKFAYRTRDEVMAYCVERMKDGISLADALDEATCMKILSRIEGDEQIVKKTWLRELNNLIVDSIKKLKQDDQPEPEICKNKLDEMFVRMENADFTSFWT